MKLKRLFLIGPLLAVIALLVYLMPDTQEVTASGPLVSLHTCSNPRLLDGYSAAYQVNVQVAAQFQQRLLYHSDLSFKQQLQQATENRIFGKASDIKLVEAQSDQQTNVERNLTDVLILSKASAEPYLVFTEFNDLGLPAQHPLSVLSQLLKNLSVHADGQSTRYAYDPLKREYQYHQSSEPGVFLRDWLTTHNGTISPMQMYSKWQVRLGDDCLPEWMAAEERAPFSATSEGYIQFTMQAKRIPDVEDLLKVRFTPNANQNMSWQVAELGTHALEREVTSIQQSWDILERVHQTKNTGQLVNAVNYLVEQISVFDLVDLITEHTKDDVVWRNLFYGLSLSAHPKAETFLLAVLTELPAQGARQDELNKVRIMVAAASRQGVSAATFDTLDAITENRQQSTNARRNALINQGTVVQQMMTQGQDATAYRDSLIAKIKLQLEQPSSDAAIFSAGNAGLIQSNQKIASLVTNKLQAGNEKERYASATVLLHDSNYTSDLVNHLASETSPLVSGVILTGLDAQTLTAQQIQQLKNLSDRLPEQSQKLIKRLIGA